MQRAVQVIAVALMVAGCTATRDRVLVPDATLRLGIAPAFSYAPASAESSASAMASTGRPTPKPYFRTAYAEATDPWLTRNQIVFELLAIIDDEYRVFERDLSATLRATNFGVALASIALTGTATFATGSAAKVLAAIDTSLKGVDQAAHSELLMGKTIEAITLQMRSIRLEQRRAILDGLAKPVGQYPLEAAIGDLANYFHDGSVVSALTSLTASAAGNAASAASGVQAAVKRIPLRDPAAAGPTATQ